MGVFVSLHLLLYLGFLSFYHRFPNKLLVALDGSALAEEALLPAAHLVAALDPGQRALYLTLVVTEYRSRGTEAGKSLSG